MSVRTTAWLVGAMAGAAGLAVPVAGAAAQDSSTTSQAAGKPDSMWGYKVDTTAPQNPPGYRGMEQPAGQDTSAAARAGQDTSGYSGTAGVDTGTSSARSRSSGAARGDTTAPDTTKVGQKSTRRVRHHERRMHPGSDTASTSRAPTSTTGQGARGDSSGMKDTTGMRGRHQSDTTMPGSTSSPTGRGTSSMDSSTSRGSSSDTSASGGSEMNPQSTRQSGQSTSGGDSSSSR